MRGTSETGTSVSGSPDSPRTRPASTVRAAGVGFGVGVATAAAAPFAARVFCGSCAGATPGASRRRKRSAAEVLTWVVRGTFNVLSSALLEVDDGRDLRLAAVAEDDAQRLAAADA